MNNAIRVLSLATTAVIALGGTISARADSTDALQGCKADITQDSRLAGQSVRTKMDTIKSRGRYVDFTIDVSATDTEGNRSDWLATCKASSTGKVKALDLARLNERGEIAVAQSN